MAARDAVFQMYVFKCFIWMLRMLQWLYMHVCKCMFRVASICFSCFKCFIWMLHNMHVASVCFKCFRCFVLMLQVFYLDVLKVYLDVA
jgi:hypothetical protein